MGLKLIERPQRTEALHAIRTLLEYLGENPNRDGLQRTPERFLKAWEFYWGVGYNDDWLAEQLGSIKSGLFKGSFGQYDEMVLVRQIKFFSHCEHHMAPFFGTADIAYIPHAGAILGLSKLARVVNMHARRLQVQERMTTDIATQMQDAADTEHVAVLVRAQHLCMMSRGVEQPVSNTVTNALRGEFYANKSTRDEFMRLVNNH